MTTPSSEPLANAGPPGRYRSDEERRAMFAHMRRGAAAPSGSSGVGRSWEPNDRTSAGKLLKDLAGLAVTGKIGGKNPEGINARRLTDVLALTLPAGSGRSAAAKRAASLKSAGRSAAVSAASTAGGASIAEYRRANPTMNPRKERALAKLQTALGIVAALSGLRAAKAGTKAAAPGMTKSIADQIARAGKYAEKIGGKVAAATPRAIRVPASKIKAAYDALTKWTGNELPSLAQIPEAARLLSRGQYKQALGKLAAPALAGATAAGVTGYEEAKIAEYQKAIEGAWKKGDSYKLTADGQPMPPLLQAIIGSTGNPVEKIAVRLPVGGRFTRDLADIANYQAAYDGIQRARELGTIRPAEADKALADLAEKKPWNMAGSGLYAIQPAAAGLLRYMASSIADDLNTARAYGIVADNPERDADTILLQDGTRVRWLGGDSTEIAHAAKKGSRDEPLAREATDRSKQIVPPGSAVRLVAGGTADEIQNPADGFEVDQPRYGRKVAYVEPIPKIIAKIPGVRRLWPAPDAMKKLLAEGLAQPRYDNLADAHSRQTEHHAAALKAYDAQRGVYAPEARAALEKGGLYRWKPGPADAPADPVAKAMNTGGTGLLVSGNAGLFRALGEKTGTLAAQIWNAALAAGGAAQNARSGTKNAKGKTYKAPKGYPTAVDERRAERRRKNAAP